MVLSFAGKKVSKEINRIMGPSSTNLSYNFASRSLMSGPASVQIERKPKRKSKLRISEELHGMPKRRLSTAVFQKKITVFNYMGASSPKDSVAVTKIYVWLDYCQQFLLKLAKRQFGKKSARLFIPAAPPISLT